MSCGGVFISTHGFLIQRKTGKLMNIFFEPNRNGVRYSGFKSKRNKLRVTDITPVPFDIFIEIVLINLQKLEQQSGIHLRRKFVVSHIDIVHKLIEYNQFSVTDRKSTRLNSSHVA